MSLKFLSLKSFHPSNKRNQKKLYLAEERDKESKRREEENAKQVLAEQEYIKNRALLSGSKLEAERSKVGFLYQLPSSIIKENEVKQQQQQQQQQDEQKSDKNLKDVDKFPILANAPVAGLVSNDVKLVHKPFGIELRNVKCARCHNWGHKSGDRECPLLNINPNDLKRLQFEDPLSNYNSNNSGSNSYSGNSNYKPTFKLTSSASSHGSSGSSNNNNSSNRNYTIEDIVNNMNNQEDQDDDDDEVEREFLASLTKKQRKLLLKQIKLEEKQAKKKKKRERERDRDRYHHRRSSNHSSDSDYSDNERDRKKRHRSSSSSSSSEKYLKKNKSNDSDQYEERVV